MSLGMSDVHPRTTIEHRPYVLFEYSLAALDLRVVLLGTPLYSPGESVGAFFQVYLQRKRETVQRSSHERIWSQLARRTSMSSIPVGIQRFR
jgi:hypothetical protein